MGKKETKEVKMILSGKACKITCKILSIFAKIGEVIFVIAAIACCVAGAMIGIGQKDININEMVTEVNKEIGDEAIVTITGPAIDKFLARSHNEQIAFILLVIAVAAIILIFSSVLARYISRFFKRLERDRTPFKLENVDLLQKIACWLFATIITADVASLLFSIALGDGMIGVNISLSTYALGFVILVLAVVFRHGYELEQKAKK